MKALKSPFILALFSLSIVLSLYLSLVDFLPFVSFGICPFFFHCLVCSMWNFLWQFISGSLGISLHSSNEISFRIFVSFCPKIQQFNARSMRLHRRIRTFSFVHNPNRMPNDINELIHLRQNFSYCYCCLLYTSPSPRDATLSRMPSSA